MLWSGEHKFPGTAETIDMLRSKGMESGYLKTEETGESLTGRLQASNLCS